MPNANRQLGGHPGASAKPGYSGSLRAGRRPATLPLEGLTFARQAVIGLLVHVSGLRRKGLDGGGRATEAQADCLSASQQPASTRPQPRRPAARHWAIVASLVATAKLNEVEPLACLTDVLERMVSGRTKAHELARLLPWEGRTARVAVDA
jgi:hypothetical protein